MPTPQRLPIVNSDDAVWGDILRQYLMKEHFNDDNENSANGGHQKITVRAGTSAAGTAPIKLTSGTLLTTPEVGAMEFNADNLYFTITTGTSRRKVALYDDSSGATGDLYYRNSSGYFTRLPVGTSNQALRVSGGIPAWTSGGDHTAATKTSSYTITSTDAVILADASSAAVTITLPTASSFNGFRFHIKRTDSVTANACTVARSGTDVIDGQTSFALALQYDAIMVVSNGTSWFIL